MRALALAAALGGAWLLPVGPPGIAVPIVAALVLGAAWTARRPSPLALALGLLALALSAQAALLDAAWIVWIDLLAAWVLGALAAGGTTFAALWAPLSRLTLAPELLPRPNASALPAMRGAVLGTVVLVPFAALFLTADAAFAELARAIPDPGVDLMPARALTFTLVLAAALGLALAARDPVHARPFRFTRRLSLAEWAIPLALLDLLFLAFVTVQLTVLFGGHDRVLRTSGLTYAEYARSGFWQLLCAAGLTFGVIAAAMLLTAPQSRRELWLRRALLGSLCALTLVILVSALHRLRLYEAAYGLTRDRLAAEALTVWLGLLFLVALAAALEPVRRRAAPLAVAGSGLLLLAGSLADPEQTIAERNIERYRATGSLDSVYLRSLSTDALPALSTLPRHLQEQTTAAILAGRDTEPWSSWNLSRSRAKERGTAVAGREAQFSRGPAFRNVP